MRVLFLHVIAWRWAFFWVMLVAGFVTVGVVVVAVVTVASVAVVVVRMMILPWREDCHRLRMGKSSVPLERPVSMIEHDV